ncbi:MAG: phosphoethanolamine--lipid A transferase [Ottowia sp.]|nr:phosphoethanolamine--lipid A transferase [Ottowia sp.]
MPESLSAAATAPALHWRGIHAGQIKARVAAAALRPRSPRTVVAVLALYLLLATNWPLWLALVRIDAAPAFWLPAAFGMAWLLLVGLLALLALTAWPRAMKPLWIALAVLAAVVQYYSNTYHMVMDPSMVRNIVYTDPAEARDLLSWQLLLQVAVVAGPIAAWLWRVPVAPRGLWPHAWRNAVLFGVALAAAAACVATMSRTLAPLMRNQPQLRYLMNPLATVWSASAVATQPLLSRKKGLAVITPGTALGPNYASGQRPPLLLLVVGETARADHFGLNGYARDTTPRLAAQDVLSWRDVTSCGTSTLASLPCMFSPLSRTRFEHRNQDSENLLDVLHAAGLAVLWLDNQSGGCKGVCARIPHAQVNDADLHPALCDAGDCLDAVLLDGLEQRIAALPPDRVARGLVVVMHQMGSHGPAYYKRSPPGDKRFLPECRSAVLSDCTQAELVNAYDNSIAYTDDILAQAIDWLRARSRRFDSGLLYLSDHGESLGEYGLYLHGAPWRIAPQVQKHVPMVAWLNGGLAQRVGLDTGCLRDRLDVPLSHDNLFHTVLGLLDVHNPSYRLPLDAFATCRQAAAGNASLR